MFTCPACGKTATNPNDDRDGWCPGCHSHTGPCAQHRGPEPGECGVGRQFHNPTRFDGLDFMTPCNVEAVTILPELPGFGALALCAPHRDVIFRQLEAAYDRHAQWLTSNSHTSPTSTDPGLPAPPASG